MQATFIQEGRSVDYTPTADVEAGQVVVQGNLVGIAKSNIPANKLGALAIAGVFDVAQSANIITAGAAVYWAATGNPVGGTAGTGAATATATGNRFMGFAQKLTAAEDTTVRVALRSAETAATVTAANVTGSVGASTAAAGTVVGDAAELPAGATVLPTTAADDSAGVKINALDKQDGRMLFIGNGVSDKLLKVYPPTGGKINGGSANAAFSSASGKGVVAVCLSSTANTWLCF